ncbi:MAG: TlyA family rRNA (cytidine-2'-O)-methyltransferase, partial [Verrucomicrobia bacterium]|nr:TlyA family rRNA (cytidine-2'-O)-methyltransferase [Leptolyngbya sp. ES-bin-22]
DPQNQAMAILQVLEAAQALGWHYHGVTWSPLLGPAGNIEYLLWLKDSELPSQQSEAVEISPDLHTLKQLTLTAQQTLTR